MADEIQNGAPAADDVFLKVDKVRSEEHTSELQSPS